MQRPSCPSGMEWRVLAEAGELREGQRIDIPGFGLDLFNLGVVARQGDVHARKFYRLQLRDEGFFIHDRGFESGPPIRPWTGDQGPLDNRRAPTRIQWVALALRPQENTQIKSLEHHRPCTTRNSPHTSHDVSIPQRDRPCAPESC